MDIINSIIPLVLASMAPLLITAIGGLITEKSGVTNIGLEGMMIFGGFVGIVVLRAVEKNGSSQFNYLIAIIVGGLSGGILSLFHAYAAIKMKADQTISATAINLFSPAFATFVLMVLNGRTAIINFKGSYIIKKVPFLSDIPILGNLLFTDTYISTFIVLGILILTSIILYKTKIGLRLRACGENPSAADAAGVNIFKIRYAAVIISGIFAGIGGVIFAVSTSNSFSPEAGVAGFGFLAIGVLIFGNWNPFRLLLVSFFFAFLRILSAVSNSIEILSNLKIPSQVYNMLPYIVVLIVLVVTSKRSRAPKAVGQIYDVGKR